ncbi:MAG: DUF3857 domain-containing protein [Bacteroidia bacterium]|nr:DUF3857 domain-containing protein [Bacteroidia bacterium]
MMRRIYLTFLITIFGILSCWAQPKSMPEFGVGNISEDMLEGVNAVVRMEEQRLEVFNTEDAELTVKRAVTIFDEKAAESEGILTVFYDNFYYKLGELNAAVYDRSGNLIQRMKKKDFADVSLGSFEVTDNRYKAFQVNVKSYPYTIYLEYTQRLSGLVFLPPWHPLERSGKSLETGSFEVIAPSEMNIRYKLVGGMEEGEVKENGGKRVYTWKAKDLSPLEYEPYSSVIQTPGVLLGPSEFEVEGKKGNSSTWKDYGLFHYKLNQGREQLSPEMAQKVKDMTSEASNSYEKVNILYKYLQKNTRYMSIQLGLGGFRTMTAQSVVEKGYGDCKALTYYMKGMLQEIDIPSHACLIYRGANPPYFHTDFAMSQFNHVLLCVPLEKDTLWVECTNDDIPAGYLSDDDNDRPLLILTEKGGLLRKTPTPDPEDNVQSRTARITIEENGAAKADVQVVYTGERQDVPRLLTTYLDQKERENWVLKRLNLSSVKMERLEIKKSEEKPKVQMEYGFSTFKWAKSSGNRLFLKLHLLDKPNNVPPKDSERKKPVVWKETFLYKDSIFFDLPDGYVIEAMGDKEKIIDRPYGSYHSSIEVTEQGDLIFIREWRQDKCFLEPQEYEDFRKFFLEVRKADQKQVVLNKRS